MSNFLHCFRESSDATIMNSDATIMNSVTDDLHSQHTAGLQEGSACLVEANEADSVYCFEDSAYFSKIIEGFNRQRKAGQFLDITLKVWQIMTVHNT